MEARKKVSLSCRVLNCSSGESVVQKSSSQAFIIIKCVGLTHENFPFLGESHELVNWKKKNSSGKKLIAFKKEFFEKSSTKTVLWGDEKKSKKKKNIEKREEKSTSVRSEGDGRSLEWKIEKRKRDRKAKWKQRKIPASYKFMWYPAEFRNFCLTISSPCIKL